MNLKVNKTIESIQPYIPGKPIEEVKREFRLKNVIKLASNENPYGPSPKVSLAIKQSVKNQILSEYTAFICVAKELVDGKYE